MEEVMLKFMQYFRDEGTYRCPNSFGKRVELVPEKTSVEDEQVTRRLMKSLAFSEGV